MGISISMLNVLGGVSVTERLLNVSVSRVTLGKDVKEPLAPMTALDMEPVSTSRTSPSLLFGETTLMRLINNR